MKTGRQVVLIVDDHPTNIELLSEVLGNDQDILFATSGPEALRISQNQLPDLILLDIMLPDMDGYEVCRRLKADARTVAIPVIFVTALNHEENEARGLEIGAIDYITKPFSPPIVRARVRNHLELKRYRDFLENLSTTDGLTGIGNRRRFDEYLDKEWRRGIRNHKPISLIMLDVDFFKDFNDCYGHLAGDDCLRQLAQIMDECVHRPGDIVARYGGEEFMCVLPETDVVGALLVAESIQRMLEDRRIPHACSTISDHVTVSMGIASTIPDYEQEQTDLVEQADYFLYQAKQNGRNRVETALPSSL